MNLKEKLAVVSNWQPPQVPETIPHGDMPGDKVQISEDHIRKTNLFFPKLLEEMGKVEGEKCVISVHGGSGVGKSETASLLAFYLNSLGIGSYVMSGDNYPRRIPLYNDAERSRIFRAEGLKGLVASGQYSGEVQEKLNVLWEQELDPDPAQVANHPWLAEYQAAGRRALAGYLGTANEQDFDEINSVIAGFRSGAESGWFKRMGRTEAERWYSQVDLRHIQVLILEWTHGGSAHLEGVDIPILLRSTPEETRAHRRSRARDGKTDSPFTTMVLEIEQKLLDDRAGFAKIILSKSGEFIDPAPLLGEFFHSLAKQEMEPLLHQGMEEVLTVDVTLTDQEITQTPEGTRVYLPFAAQAVGELFTGLTLPGAADDQIHKDGKLHYARADYVLEGRDYAGQYCQVHVVNQTWGGPWKPAVTTDSKVLNFLNGADCAAVLEHRPQGPIVHIFATR